MEIDWELTEKSAKFIHHGECESWYSYLFRLHLNTYDMDLRPSYIFNSFSAAIELRRQNLTTTDVRSWRPKSVPALKELITEEQ